MVIVFLVKVIIVTVIIINIIVTVIINVVNAVTVLIAIAYTLCGFWRITGKITATRLPFLTCSTFCFLFLCF